MEGKPLLIQGICSFPIIIKDLPFTHDFFVCSDDSVPHKCIIGADFLLKHGFCLDFAARTLSNKDVSVQILCSTTTVPQHQLIKADLNVSHRILCPANSKPIYCRPYRIPIHLQSEVDKQIKDMLEKAVIVPSQSPWASPVLLTPKKNGTYRFCVNFRRLNAMTVPDKHPLPLIEEVLDSLVGQSVYSTLDLQSGYWQIPLHPDDQEKTAFTIQGLGHFQFQVMPFGLNNAPATFQRAMEGILRDIDGCQVYLDDIIVSGATIEEHDRRLDAVLKRLQNANLTLNESKCHFRKTAIEYLGHSVSAAGVRPNGDKIEAILKMKTPENISELRSFLGLTNYYRRFINHYSNLAEPLMELTRKNTHFVWTQRQQRAVDHLRLAISSCRTLQFPHADWTFIVATDASNVGLGASLRQLDPSGNEHVIAFASRALTKPERNLSTIERECLALVWATAKWRHYLLGKCFQIECDHKPLLWLDSMKDTNTKLSRWIVKLTEYNFTLKHVKGEENVVADALSRLPIPVQTLSIDKELTTSELATLQAQDEELAQVIFQKRANDPEFRPQALIGPARRYTQLWDEIIFRSGVLCRRRKDGFSTVIIPRILRPRVLAGIHESGHIGTDASVQMLRERYYWPGMITDMENFVAQCLQCNRRKAWSKQPIIQPRPILCSTPMECWSMDIIGPLPETSAGNQYILTMCDMFTKWPEAVALPEQSAEAIAKAIVSRIITTHGVPHKILSDQGRNFES